MLNQEESEIRVIPEKAGNGAAQEVSIDLQRLEAINSK